VGRCRATFAVRIRRRRASCATRIRRRASSTVRPPPGELRYGAAAVVGHAGRALGAWPREAGAASFGLRKSGAARPCSGGGLVGEREGEGKRDGGLCKRTQPERPPRAFLTVQLGPPLLHKLSLINILCSLPNINKSYYTRLNRGYTPYQSPTYVVGLGNLELEQSIVSFLLKSSREPSR
jgi:hypothetical protein